MSSRVEYSLLPEQPTSPGCVTPSKIRSGQKSTNAAEGIHSPEDRGGASRSSSHLSEAISATAAKPSIVALVLAPEPVQRSFPNGRIQKGRSARYRRRSRFGGSEGRSISRECCNAIDPGETGCAERPWMGSRISNSFLRDLEPRKSVTERRGKPIAAATALRAASVARPPSGGSTTRTMRAPSKPPPTERVDALGRTWTSTRIEPFARYRCHLPRSPGRQDVERSSLVGTCSAQLRAESPAVRGGWRSRLRP